MQTRIRNEPLRLVLSDREKAFIREGLRTAKRRCAAWAMVAALGAGAVLVGLYRHDEVPIAIQIDKVLAETGEETTGSVSAAACSGTEHVYAGTRRSVSFCDDPFQHAMFRARLKAATEEKGFWPDLTRLLIIAWALVLLPSLAGLGGALLALRKYARYGSDLDAFLRRFNRRG